MHEPSLVRSENASFRHIVAPVSVSLIGVLSMALTAYLLNAGTVPLLTVSPHRMVNLTFTMQLIILLVSGVALVFVYLYNRENFKTFFRWTTAGNKSDWAYIGPVVAIGFTLGNALLMAGGVMSENGA